MISKCVGANVADNASRMNAYTGCGGGSAVPISCEGVAEVVEWDGRFQLLLLWLVGDIFSSVDVVRQTSDTNRR